MRLDPARPLDEFTERWFRPSLPPSDDRPQPVRTDGPAFGVGSVSTDAPASSGGHAWIRPAKMVWTRPAPELPPGWRGVAFCMLARAVERLMPYPVPRGPVTGCRGIVLRILAGLARRCW